MRARSLVLWIAAVSFLLFASLRTRSYTSVDGAVRCLEVFHRQALFVHENNHLLYPVNVYLWHRLLGALGLGAETPAGYLARTQLMNAAAAAVALAAFAGLLWLATASRRAALLGAALLGLSRAFLLHATNSAEPMAGFLWSCLALLLLALALRRDSPARAAAAGALFAAALASYQSMALVAPAGLVLCLAAQPRRPRLLLATIAGGLLGTGLIYGLAYGLTGTTAPGAMVHRFFSIGGAPGTFGGLSLRKAATLPLGLAHNLVAILPDGFTGFRSLLREPVELFQAALAVLGVFAFSFLAVLRTRRAWPRLPPPARLGIAAGLTGACAALVAPAAWEPLYDKLWLQPAACLIFVLTVALASGAFPVRGKQIGLLFAAVLSLNLAGAVADHRGTTPYLAEAEQVARRVAPRDLVVRDWDQISVLYGAFWGDAPDRHTFDFPTRSVRSGPGVTAELGEAVRRTRERGGRVFFLGILDQTPDHWQAFLGQKANVPFAVLQPFRDRARTVDRFPYGAATVTLREEPAPAPAPALPAAAAPPPPAPTSGRAAPAPS